MTDQFDMFSDNVTEDERRVLSLILCGKENARSVKFLAQETRISERTLRLIVRQLIDEQHMAIGSSTKPPAGYFIINTPDEADEQYEALRRRGISILTRAANIKGLTPGQVFGQGVL